MKRVWPLSVLTILICHCAAGQAASFLITALRYRQLYTFQNQFISRIEFSCLRDAPTSTSVTHFGSISSPSPLVLSTYGPLALESFQRVSTVGAVHARHCAAELGAGVYAAVCASRSEFNRNVGEVPQPP